MVSLASTEPLKLEYYLEDEYRWCKLEIIKSVMGRLEKTAIVTSLSQLPDNFHAKYLYLFDLFALVFAFVSFYGVGS